VRRVVEVIPQAVKVALGLLGALLALVGIGAAVNAVRARRLQFQRHQLVEEVGLLQGALLPEIPTRIGSTWASAAYRPADGPAAGGNFYDAFELAGGGVGVVVGEVCGQGKDRLSESLLVRHALRTHVRAGLAPAEVVARARTELDRDLSGDLGGLVVAAYDPDGGRISYASVGDLEPLIVVDGEAVATEPAPERSPELPEKVRAAEVRFPVGARACLFSTGLIEARVNGHVMGREGVTRIVGDLGRDLTAETLVEEVAASSRSLPGDLAACVIEADDDPALTPAGDRDLVADGQAAGS
jgi:serine phosphatase RsbU (regulator of sigma subunit)